MSHAGGGGPQDRGWTLQPWLLILPLPPPKGDKNEKARSASPMSHAGGGGPQDRGWTLQPWLLILPLAPSKGGQIEEGFLMSWIPVFAGMTILYPSQQRTKPTDN